MSLMHRKAGDHAPCGKPLSKANKWPSRRGFQKFQVPRIPSICGAPRQQRPDQEKPVSFPQLPQKRTVFRRRVPVGKRRVCSRNKTRPDRVPLAGENGTVAGSTDGRCPLSVSVSAGDGRWSETSSTAVSKAECRAGGAILCHRESPGRGVEGLTCRKPGRRIFHMSSGEAETEEAKQPPNTKLDASGRRNASRADV
jgi:hypothetical protein